MFDAVILNVAPDLMQCEYEALLPLVSVEKQERIKKFRFFRDARNCLLGDILARVEICRITGLKNNQLEFSTNEYGKPFLLNHDVHFNISHAGDYIACAISDEPIGIDVETMKPFDIKIADRFFLPDEVAYIKAVDKKQRFYEIWTKKESRIKWEGKGLHIPLSSFSVFDSCEQVRPTQPTYHKIFSDNEVVCHACSMKKSAPFVRLVSTESIIKLTI